MHRFVQGLSMSMCLSELRTSMEDVLVGHCLMHLGIQIDPTLALDELPAHPFNLFHPSSPASVFAATEDWMLQLSMHIKAGDECCSAASISFQNIKSPDYDMMLFHKHIN